MLKYAGVAELADAPALGAGAFGVQVRLLSPAPKKTVFGLSFFI